VSHQINLNELDKSGDVRQIAEDAGVDRGTFLRNGAIAGAGAVGLGIFGLPSLAQATISSSKKSAKNDLKIANYALTLEYLEAAFYARAVELDLFAKDETGVLLKQFATVVAGHEAAHVTKLKKAIKGFGGKAVASPKLDTSAVDTAVNADNFAKTAEALEDTGVAAYAGQGPNVLLKPVVQLALSIHSVEARHAAWIRFINGGGAAGAARATYPAPANFDDAASQKATLAIVGKTKLVKSYDTKLI
jgi:hypothetical protein